LNFTAGDTYGARHSYLGFREMDRSHRLCRS
jgi:hypothetical protein